MLDKKGLSAEKIYESLEKTGVYRKMSKEGKDRARSMLMEGKYWWEPFGSCLTCRGSRCLLGRPVFSDRRRNAWGWAVLETRERVLDTIIRGADWWGTGRSPEEDKTIGKGLIAYADTERDPYRVHQNQRDRGSIKCSVFSKGVDFYVSSGFRVVIGPQLKPMRGGE